MIAYVPSLPLSGSVPLSWLCRRALTLRGRPLTDAELEAGAIVFAPHPDDETLGCGGTIARKRARGAEVGVVFMTDGSESHAHLMPPAQLRVRRQSEARAACAELDVDAADLVFLDLPDGNLRSRFTEARRRVAEIIAARRPEQLFVPYRLETPDDHRATRDVVLAALDDVPVALRRGVVVYEYPVWFWDHWPWMRQERWRRGVWSLRRAGFGLPAWRDLAVASSLNGVLDQKQRALAAYGSQMTSLDGDPAWPTLSDVAGGDFLRCFFSASEYFHVSRPAGATGR